MPDRQSGGRTGVMAGIDRCRAVCGTGRIPVSTKIVKIVGGRLDGKELRSDRLTEDDAHVGDMQLLLVDDDAPPGKRYAVREYIDGRPVPHVYVVVANSLVGDVRTIVLEPAQKR